MKDKEGRGRETRFGGRGGVEEGTEGGGYRGRVKGRGRENRGGGGLHMPTHLRIVY